MAIGLLGRKVGMTQLYDESGTAVAVTVLEAGPCAVLQIRTPESDGYEAVQLGYQEKPRPRGQRKRRCAATRSQRGHVAAIGSKRAKKRAAAGLLAPPKADCEPPRIIREFRTTAEGVAVGDVLRVDQFAEIKSVDVTGTSKGRGTAGVMKRHNFAGQRASHGVKKCHRHAGGTSASADPSRVFKGRKMAGRYGAQRCTTRNLKVVTVDVDNNLLLVRGAVPGPNGSYVLIRETNKV